MIVTKKNKWRWGGWIAVGQTFMRFFHSPAVPTLYKTETVTKNTDYFGIYVNAMLNVSSILFKQDRMPSWICRYFLFFNIQIHLGTETD